MKLAVTLAERFNGEIINGDAIQMYDGLPIASNKMPVEERKSIPHHLLGCISSKDKPWDVYTFRRNAIKVIDNIRSRGKLPILVGGTHYYTQALILRASILEAQPHKAMLKDESDLTWPILGARPEEMLEELRKIDPIMAARWHPNDARKIRRSLEICLTTGKKASELYENQSKRKTSTDSNISTAESPLLFDALIFWTHVDFSVLQLRLSERVEAMVSSGLIAEARAMFCHLQDLESAGHFVDQSSGIWVAIGYKEYLPLLLASRDAKVDMEKLELMKQEGIERTKIETIQYARRQIKWIQNSLLRVLEADGLEKRLYLLDATDLSQRSHNVDDLAHGITAKFLRGDAVPSPKSISNAAKKLLITKPQVDRYSKYCDLCCTTMMSSSWDEHLEGKKHKYALNALKPKPRWRELYPRRGHANEAQSTNDDPTRDSVHSDKPPVKKTRIPRFPE